MEENRPWTIDPSLRTYAVPPGPLKGEARKQELAKTITQSQLPGQRRTKASSVDLGVLLGKFSPTTPPHLLNSSSPHLLIASSPQLSSTTTNTKEYYQLPTNITHSPSQSTF
jgi:hypothetical protein